MKKNVLLTMSGIGLAAILFLLWAGKTPSDSLVVNDPQGQFAMPRIPSEITFADEKAAFEDADVRERFDRELLVNTFWHSNTILMLKRANKFFPLIEPILEEHGVPNDFKYLCMIESGLSNVISPSNAAGFWQFLAATGKRYGLEVNDEVDERFDLVKSTHAACLYLKDNKQRLGSWTLAAAAYNMGETGVERQLQQQGVSSYYDLHLNDETARYLFRILAAKAIYSNPEQYGFLIEPEAMYVYPATRSVVVDGSVASWTQFAIDQGTNFKNLKILNPWIRERSLKNTARKSYTVYLPKNSIPVK